MSFESANWFPRGVGRSRSQVAGGTVIVRAEVEVAAVADIRAVKLVAASCTL